MNIDPELIACVRAEYDCLRKDLQNIERGEWRGATRQDAQLVKVRMRRLARLVMLNDWGASKPH